MQILVEIKQVPRDVKFFKEFHGIEAIKEEESIKLEHSTLSTREEGIEEIVVKRN